MVPTHLGFITNTPLKNMTEEKSLQHFILDYLTKKGIFHYRNNSGTMFSEYKGKTRAFKLGVVGSPDIICVINGQYVGIEVKSQKGKQSEGQINFQKALEKAGGLYLLVRCPEDVLKVIN